MKKYWLAFVSTQAIGVLSGVYSMSLQVGVGGWRESLWILASVLLSPGVLLQFAAGALEISWLGKWYSFPLFTLVVAANAASWAAVAYLVGKRTSAAHRA